MSGFIPLLNTITASDIAAAVANRVYEGSETHEGMLRIILAAVAGKRQGIGTETETYLAIDGATPRVTFTPTDSDGNGPTTVNGT